MLFKKKIIIMQHLIQQIFISLLVFDINSIDRIPQLYDLDKTFEQNRQQGPLFKGYIPTTKNSDRTQWKMILGYHVASPIGIAACPLTATSAGIALASALGFDIITFKTICSRKRKAHNVPNITHLSAQQYVTQNNLADAMYATKNLPKHIGELALANSIGNPSPTLVKSLAEIKRARSMLREGQILIVSVFGQGSNEEEICKDFAYLARKVKKAGAQIVEANLSCPNIYVDNFLYLEPTVVSSIVKAMVKKLHETPLIIKVGLFPDKETMRTVLRACAQAGARGITGINTISMEILNENNEPYFGNQRKKAGVSGAPIHELACTFIKDAMEINNQENLGLTIFGCGGVTRAEQFDDFLNAGASAALCASIALFDPYIALRYKNIR